MINYTNQELALILLSQFDFMTSKKYEAICLAYEDLNDILVLKEDELSKLKKILKDNFDVFINTRKEFNFKKYFEELEERGIKIITYFSNDYPNNLKKLADIPYVLYYVGDISLINTKSIAVVGTRKPTNYGYMVTEKFTKELVKNNITIVSGLAVGIDKIAHTTALDQKGKTIAVLGGGFNHIFPAINIDLARTIAKKGLILTEYALDIAPTKYTFPHRNRIIAALSNGILIPEAGKKSGTFYTMDYGLDLGISTFCVPGSINNESSYGTNDMIRQGLAQCAIEPEDILFNLGIYTNQPKNKKEENQNFEQLSLEEVAICNLLKDGEKDFEFLQENTGYSTQTLNISLTSMEIRGIIKRLAGNMFMLY